MNGINKEELNKQAAQLLNMERDVDRSGNLLGYILHSQNGVGYKYFESENWNPCENRKQARYLIDAVIDCGKIRSFSAYILKELFDDGILDHDMDITYRHGIFELVTINTYRIVSASIQALMEK